MVKMLDTRCEVCGSWSWCGRKCGKAPGNEGWVPVLMTHGAVAYCPACHEEHVETYTCNAKYYASQPVNTPVNIQQEQQAQIVDKRTEYHRQYQAKRRAARREAQKAKG
jgi:hypothetical protein